MIGDDDLDAAVAAGLLSPDLRAKLVAFAASRRETKTAGAVTAPQAKFDPVHVLYYAGALLVTGAMGLFANVKHATRLPGGLCVAVAVSMAPLAIYGVQDALGLWAAQRPGGYQEFYPLINGSWVYMEIGAVVAAALALLRFPFIVLISAFALWFLSMDLAALIAHRHTPDWESDWELRLAVSKIVGLVMIAVAWAIDLKWSACGDFAFWLHLFGAMTLWGAITSGAGGEFSKALYCAFNIIFIAFGLVLDRRIYAVLGAIGLTIYLGHLAFDVFKDVLAFSFALSAIGLAIIFAGVFVERRRHAFGMLIDAYLPEVLRALRPPRARHA
jgi:hypothetical protein